jgi:hypothetical protein
VDESFEKDIYIHINTAMKRNILFRLQSPVLIINSVPALAKPASYNKTLFLYWQSLALNVTM